MKNLFNSIKLTRPKSNAFDLTHDVKLSLNMAQLTPIMLMEAVPGDKFNISCESLLRFAPLISPVMHRLDVTMHYFFVPNRILWPNWENYITNTEQGGSLPAHPTVTIDAVNYTSLCDYLGIPNPIGVEQETVSALPFAAYQKIYNEYYRDQNLIEEVLYELTDGDNTANDELYNIRTRAWEHDYFTAALPFAQKGDAVDIPLGNVILDPTTTGTPQLVRNTLDHSLAAPGPLDSLPGGELGENLIIDVEKVIDPNGTLTTEPTTINDLRRAFKLQEWLEKNARGGTRYIENILAHFGVRSSDKRLQRPEYITGVKSPVIISEVLNTSDTVNAPQGNMSGHGVSVTSGKYGSYKCEEHGYIIGVMSVLPRTAYQQGIHKHWLKYNDPTELYWPSFAHIGEQEVLNKEIYAFNGGGASDLPFGYVPRYAEYKYEPSRVAGEFRTSLDFWHMGRKFSAPPSLNSDFVQADPTTRIFAVEDAGQNYLYAHVLNKVKAIRPMPVFGTPTF